jgi:uncharacterized membrane protein YfcA
MSPALFSVAGDAGPLLAADAVPGLLLLVLASFLAGAINSFAGGGTILTFPVLAAILPADPARLVTANVTSTLGLWPSAIAAAWAYRGERAGQPPWARWLILPSVAGAVVGGVLLLVLPPDWFDAVVPWLILLAAVLFSLQPQVAALTTRRPQPRGMPAPASPAGVSGGRLAVAAVLQFLVAVYGGYFGAGIGILMLAVLGALGLGDIHRLNGVKNVLGSVVNGVAAIVFAGGWVLGTHGVSWPHVAVMAVAAILGSLGGSHLARRLPAPLVRRCVAAIGFALAGYYFWHHWQA